MKTRLILYPLAAFGAYTVAALATTRWWIRHAELNELLGQISDTPAPPVRPELVAAVQRSAAACRHRQPARIRSAYEQLEHEWETGR